LNFNVLVIFNEFSANKQVILAIAPEVLNQQKVLEGEIKKLQIKDRKIKSKIFFKDK